LNISKLSEKHFGQLIVPTGKRASMIFADGSRVTVRPGSKVIFPTMFAQNEREIYVQGEAFLEVSKNKKRPFIVKTELMDVEVLGTSFDVSAYPGENEQSVVLVTGSVKVRSASSDETKIVPNQRYSFDKTSQMQFLGHGFCSIFIVARNHIHLYSKFLKSFKFPNSGFIPRYSFTA
jgi:ferric-dicitrate binding protein FerR (iron transport regulator)